MGKKFAKKQERIAEIKTEFGLTEIGANYFDPGGQTNLLQTVTHQALLTALSKGEIINALNVLQVGSRLQETMITDQFTDTEQQYLSCLRDEMSDLETNDMSGRFRKAFETYEFVVRGLNRSLKDFEYQARENNQGGILSTLIGRRIALEDATWIQGVHGGVRAGKTRMVGRLGYNTNQVVEKLLRHKVGFSTKDWVYDKGAYLDRLLERKDEHTLKGSQIVLEEAGDTLNSARFWDEDVVGSVNILRQQGYLNTALYIISQLHKDVVNKARGLMHAVAVPWKDYRSRPIELDKVSSIDLENKLSSWKIDTLDVNPMDGGSYPQGIKVALGKVKRLDVLLPPAALNTQIGRKDAHHKDKKIDDQYYKTLRANLTAGDRATLTKCAREILDNIDDYLNPKGTWKTSKIGSKWGLGGRLAVKVRDRAAELYDAEIAKKGRRPVEDGANAVSNPATGNQEQGAIGLSGGKDGG